MSTGYLDKTGLQYFWGKIKSKFVLKAGDTLTGKLNAKANQYTDSYTGGALNMNNSNIDNVNGIYTADASDGGGEGINFYRDSTHVDTLYARSGRVYFQPNRALGQNPTPNEVVVNGVSNFSEAYLAWGGKSFSGSYGCIDAAMIDTLGANRFAFLKAAGITIEYSTDGGTTWSDYGSPDVNKTGLFGNGATHYLGKHSAYGSSTLDDMLRVTISTSAAGIYTVLNKIAIYMSTMGNTVQVKIEKALESTPDNYITHYDWTGITGWSGWNILNIASVTTYGNAPASQYGRIRFIFRQTAVTTTYNAAQIHLIMGFGGVGWTCPSTMAKTGHLYSYDNSQNATFPAKVTATEFVGNLAGTLGADHGGTGQTTAKNAANAFMNALDTGSSTPVDADYYISQYVNGGTTTTTYHRRPVSALWEYIKGKISSVLGLTASQYNGNAATATLATNAENAATANGHMVNIDVPADAKFTDTVSTVAWDSTNKKLTKTINGTTTDVVTAATLRTGLNVANGAEVNQNAFSNVAVGGSTIQADSKTDTLTITGENGISVYGATSTDTVTIGFIDQDFEEYVKSLDMWGSANGVATLGSDGKVPSSQLPSSSVPVTGVKGDAESSYRSGQVNLTPANIGALGLDGGTLTGSLTVSNHSSAIGYSNSGTGSKSISSGTSAVALSGDISITAGTWMLVGQVEFPANNTGVRHIEWRDGSTAIGASQLTQTATTGSIATRMQSTIIVNATASKNMHLYCYQNSGGAKTVTYNWQLVRIA